MRHSERFVHLIANILAIPSRQLRLRTDIVNGSTYLDIYYPEAVFSYHIPKEHLGSISSFRAYLESHYPELLV